MTQYDYHIFKDEGVNIAVTTAGDLGYLGLPYLGLQTLQKAAKRVLDDSLTDPKESLEATYCYFVDTELAAPSDDHVELKRHTVLDYPDSKGDEGICRRTILIGLLNEYVYFVKADVDKLEEYQSTEDLVVAGIKLHKDDLIDFIAFQDKVIEEFMNTLF